MTVDVLANCPVATIAILWIAKSDYSDVWMFQWAWTNMGKYGYLSTLYILNGKSCICKWFSMVQTIILTS